ncbi:MAG: DUF4118 domain-containing protein [Clostridia bacterium]|nr:DUF4118 domain-containing protein [Clostridia bacterium]
MKDDKRPNVARDALVFAGIMALAVALSMALSGLHNDNNPFATPLFILAVALVARLTDGYLWGIAASLVGTFCVNYMFTYPFWQFDVTLTGYPLTFLMMLVVSVIISALTTQIKRQEQLRFEMEREKMHANLLRAIAHDIRTPLSAIMGASSALKAQALDEADREALLDGINRDAQWLVRVTENLLSVTRFTGGDVALTKTDEVLEEIVGSAILKYRRAPDALPVHVTQPEQILIVPMDATLIEQVLINLFDNVSAHGRTATRIWLTITCNPGRAVLCVEDDGVGVPDHRLPELLDGSDHRGAQERPDARRSMGIGLSVCRTIVRAHGGDMKIGRSPRGGVAVKFYLPCEAEQILQDSEVKDVQ